jgi:hypothetical protein
MLAYPNASSSFVPSNILFPPDTPLLQQERSLMADVTLDPDASPPNRYAPPPTVRSPFFFYFYLIRTVGLLLIDNAIFFSHPISPPQLHPLPHCLLPQSSRLHHRPFRPRLSPRRPDRHGSATRTSPYLVTRRCCRKTPICAYRCVPIPKAIFLCVIPNRLRWNRLPPDLPRLRPRQLHDARQRRLSFLPSPSESEFPPQRNRKNWDNDPLDVISVNSSSNVATAAQDQKADGTRPHTAPPSRRA